MARRVHGRCAATCSYPVPPERLYTVGFDNTQGGDLRGAILRFDGRTNAPLPSPGNTGAVFVRPTEELVRPIGITFTRQ